MLSRYRTGRQGQYDEAEMKDIYTVSQFLHTKFMAGEQNLSQLERDYVKYCKKVFWHKTKYTTLAGCLCFIGVDMVYPINKFRMPTRWAIKFITAGFVIKQGLNLALDGILEFPMMNEVIGEAIIKYTEWIDISES